MPAAWLQTLIDEIEFTEGMEIERGYISPYFVQNQELQTCDFNKPRILITDRKITNMNELVPLLEGLIKTKVGAISSAPPPLQLSASPLRLSAPPLATSPHPSADMPSMCDHPGRSPLASAAAHASLLPLTAAAGWCVRRSRCSSSPRTSQERRSRLLCAALRLSIGPSP